MALWGGAGGVERSAATLRQDPLLANSMWCACRIRWHTQLKVPVEEIRKLMQSHPAADLLPGEAKPKDPLTGDEASRKPAEQEHQRTGATETYHDKQNDEHDTKPADYHQEQTTAEAPETDDHLPQQAPGEVKQEDGHETGRTPCWTPSGTRHQNSKGKGKTARWERVPNGMTQLMTHRGRRRRTSSWRRARKPTPRGTTCRPT